jgi:diguanylate cyclase (GGDEF)-like protein/PAS domain S-box-containing protein
MSGVARPSGVPDPERADGIGELLRALERFPSLFSLSRDAVVLCDPNGRRLLGNDMAKELIGGDFNGSHFAGDVAPAELAAFDAMFKTAFSGEPVEFESIFVRRDGVPVNVVVRLFPALVDTRIVGVYGTARDITALRQAEAGRDESREQFRSLFEQHPDSISMVDTSGRYERVNAAGERMLGCRSADVVGRKVGTFVPPGGAQDAIEHLVMEIIHGGKPRRFMQPFFRKDGSRGEAEGTAVPIVVTQNVSGLFLMSHDVTDRLRVAEALALQARRTHALYELAAQIGAEADAQADSALAFGLKELGFDAAFVVTEAGDALTIERSAGTKLPLDAGDPLFRQLFRETIEGSGLLEIGDAALKLRSDAAPAFCRAFLGIPLDIESGRYGALGFARLSPAPPLTDFDREFVRAVGELAAVSIERANEDERLQGLAHFDGLTGLPNRLLLSDRFRKAIALAQRRGEHVAVYFIDVDRFKAINDTYGHHVGDEILRTIAGRLLKACRASDTVARLGGDEFIVLQCGPSTENQPDELAARLRAALEAPTEVEGLHLNLSVGIGISVFPQDGHDERTLLESADRALYIAKAAGAGSVRNCAEGARGGARLAATRPAAGKPIPEDRS